MGRLIIPRKVKRLRDDVSFERLHEWICVHPAFCKVQNYGTLTKRIWYFLQQMINEKFIPTHLVYVENMSEFQETLHELGIDHKHKHIRVVTDHLIAVYDNKVLALILMAGYIAVAVSDIQTLPMPDYLFKNSEKLQKFLFSPSKKF